MSKTIKTSPKEMIGVVEDKFPRLWGTVYSRAFAEGGGFYSVKNMAASMTSSVILAQRGDFINNSVMKLMVAQTIYSIQYKLPVFFLKEDILLALSRTEIPKNLDISSIRFPFPAVSFIFPVGKMNFNGRKIEHITMSHLPQGRMPDLIIPEEGIVLKRELAKTCMGVTTSLSSTTQESFYFLTDFKDNKNTLNDVIDKYGKVRNFNDPYAILPPLDSKDDDNAFIHYLFELGLKIILLMQARPQLVKGGHIVRKANIKKKKRELWFPNYIGGDYKIIRKNEGVSEETGRSIRMHWKSGHFKNQVYGSRRNPQHKYIWIESYMAGS